MSDPNFNALLAVTKGVKAGDVSVADKTARFAEFPVDEYKLRYAKAIALMEDQGLDALLVTQYENVRYFTGYLSLLWISKFRPYVGLLPRDPAKGPSLIVPGQETGNAEETSWIKDLYIYPDQEPPVPHILKAIKDKGLANAKIGTELGFGLRLGMNFQQFSELRDGHKGKIVDGTPIIQTVRMVKSQAELSCIRKACEISQIGTRAGFEALQPGQSLKEIMATICSAMYKAGAEPGFQPSMFTITSGANYKMVNSLATDYRVKEGDLVMIDAGAVYQGYSTDYIRQASVGEPTKEQVKYYDIAVRANNAAIDKIRPGVSGTDVYEAGMDVFRAEGVFDYNVLTIVGHSVGMDVHEVPWLGEKGVYSSETNLVPGMVVCIEPVFGGYNDPEWKKGVWIQEDKVLVTETGHEILTNGISKDLWVQPVLQRA